MARHRILLTTRARHPVAEETHAESKYYQRQIEAQVPLRAALLDGRELRGQLVWFTAESLGLERPDGTLTVLGKATIKYLSKDDSRPRNVGTGGTVRRWQPPASEGARGGRDGGGGK